MNQPFTTSHSDSLVSAATKVLSEGIVTAPAYYVRGAGKHIGKDLIDGKDLGSEVDKVARVVERMPLFGKYIEVHAGSASIRGECVGFSYIQGQPQLLIRDSAGKEVWIEADKSQREIYAFTPAKKEVSTTGTGSSDNPMLYSFGKTNY